MNSICCYDIWSNPVQVSPDTIAFSPAVFGIMIEGGKVLLTRHPQTNLWHPPGCLLGLLETPLQAVRRHFLALTGFLPQMGPVIYVEDQYRVDEQDQAWHLSALYYALDRPLGHVIALSSEHGKHASLVDIIELERSQMQFGFDAIRAGSMRHEL